MPQHTTLHDCTGLKFAIFMGVAAVVGVACTAPQYGSKALTSVHDENPIVQSITVWTYPFECHLYAGENAPENNTRSATVFRMRFTYEWAGASQNAGIWFSVYPTSANAVQAAGFGLFDTKPKDGSHCKGTFAGTAIKTLPAIADHMMHKFGQAMGVPWAGRALLRSRALSAQIFSFLQAIPVDQLGTDNIDWLNTAQAVNAKASLVELAEGFIVKNLVAHVLWSFSKSQSSTMSAPERASLLEKMDQQQGSPLVALFSRKSQHVCWKLTSEVESVLNGMKAAELLTQAEHGALVQQLVRAGNPSDTTSRPVTHQYCTSAMRKSSWPDYDPAIQSIQIDRDNAWSTTCRRVEGKTRVQTDATIFPLLFSFQDSEFGNYFVRYRDPSGNPSLGYYPVPPSDNALCEGHVDEWKGKSTAERSAFLGREWTQRVVRNATSFSGYSQFNFRNSKNIGPITQTLFGNLPTTWKLSDLQGGSAEQWYANDEHVGRWERSLEVYLEKAFRKRVIASMIRRYIDLRVDFKHPEPRSARLLRALLTAADQTGRSLTDHFSFYGSLGQTCGEAAGAIRKVCRDMKGHGWIPQQEYDEACEKTGAIEGMGTGTIELRAVSTFACQQLKKGKSPITELALILDLPLRPYIPGEEQGANHPTPEPEKPVHKPSASTEELASKYSSWLSSDSSNQVAREAAIFRESFPVQRCLIQSYFNVYQQCMEDVQEGAQNHPQCEAQAKQNLHQCLGQIQP